MNQGNAVLIVGGGIGGLACALALARKGICSHVLERRAAFSEDGAGIQVGPNGVHILEQLGVAQSLALVAGVPEAIAVVEGGTGRHLQRLPLGSWIAGRHGAPYWVLHRADLHNALLTKACADTHITITTGFACDSLEVRGDDVVATAENGKSAHGRLAIGADGVWSTVRMFVDPAARPKAIGKLAMRTILDRSDTEGHFSRDQIGVWLAPGRHVVHYPIRSGREIAVVVIGPEIKSEAGWGRDISASTVMSCIEGYAGALRDFLSRGQDWRAWSLYEGEFLGRWSRGSVGLLGDAAHPILPFLAQGGVMALEDAVVLADLLAEAPNVATALRQYEVERSQRVRKIMATARRNGQIYALDGPFALARNFGMMLIGGERIMAGYDWIYGWKPSSTGAA